MKCALNTALPLDLSPFEPHFGKIDVTKATDGIVDSPVALKRENCNSSLQRNRSYSNCSVNDGDGDCHNYSSSAFNTIAKTAHEFADSTGSHDEESDFNLFEV